MIGGPRAPGRDERLTNLPPYGAKYLRYRACVSPEELPPDPFANDPDDPAKVFDATSDDHGEPMSDDERSELLADLADLGIYQELLEPRGVRGIVVDCVDCEEPHFHEWHLLRASLEQLLGDGKMRPHEPAFAPNPMDYVSWDYCRGFADGIGANENAR